jgi:hypothetical protein
LGFVIHIARREVKPLNAMRFETKQIRIDNVGFR